MGGYPDYEPPQNAADPAVIEAAVEAYLDLNPPGIPDHNDTTLRDAAAAHPASSVTVGTLNGLLSAASGGTVEDALQAADNISSPDLAGHLSDTSDAHDASAISVGTLNGNLSAASGTDVEQALQAVDNLSLGGSVATDTIWDASGDIAYGTGADTAARLALGTRGQALVAGASAPKYQRMRPFGGTPTAVGTIAVSTPNWTSVTSQTLLNSQRVALFPIMLDEGETITSITFWSGTQAAVTPANQWFALCDSNCVALRYTVDDTSTAWNANTAKTLALTSTFTTTYRGLHYVGILVNAGTTPALRSAVAAVTITNLSINGNTGQTTPPAEGVDLNDSASTGLGFIPYIEVA